MYKPRLTAKVLRGIEALLNAAYAGNALAGDLAPDAEAVEAVQRWCDGMGLYRAWKGQDDHGNV